MDVPTPVLRSEVRPWVGGRLAVLGSGDGPASGTWVQVQGASRARVMTPARYRMSVRMSFWPRERALRPPPAVSARGDVPIRLCTVNFLCNRHRRLSSGRALLARGTAPDEGIVDLNRRGYGAWSPVVHTYAPSGPKMPTELGKSEH